MDKAIKYYERLKALRFFVNILYTADTVVWLLESQSFGSQLYEPDNLEDLKALNELMTFERYEESIKYNIESKKTIDEKEKAKNDQQKTFDWLVDNFEKFRFQQYYLLHDFSKEEMVKVYIAMWDENFLKRIKNPKEVDDLVAQNPFSLILEELWEDSSMMQCAWEGGHLKDPYETSETHWKNGTSYKQDFTNGFFDKIKSVKSKGAIDQLGEEFFSQYNCNSKKNKPKNPKLYFDTVEKIKQEVERAKKDMIDIVEVKLPEQSKVKEFVAKLEPKIKEVEQIMKKMEKSNGLI